MIKSITFFFLGFISLSSFSQVWEYFGDTSFSISPITSESINITTYKDTPFVVFSEVDSGNRISVMKYNGANWVYVGAPAFSNTNASFNSIFIDTNGVVYVSFKGQFARTEVMTYNGTSWVPYGGGFAFSSISYCQNVRVNKDTVYVAYKQGTTGGVCMKKYDGTSWVDVGLPNFSYGTNIYSLDLKFYNDTPYVSYISIDSSYKVYVEKYNGSSWEVVGASPAVIDSCYSPTLSFDDLGNIYVGYILDASDDLKVNKYTNGSGWTSIGGVIDNTGGTSYASIATYNNDVYIGYEKGSVTAIKKYNGGVWSSIGTSFNANGGQHKITISDTGKVFLAFENTTESGKGSVIHYTCNSYHTIYDNACDHYVSPSGSHVWTSTGTYKDTLHGANANGCDSIITVNLNVVYSSSSIQTISSCDSLISPSGNHIWHTSGTYYDTLANANIDGCDSLITINLTISSLTSTISQSVGTCRANINGAQYQWMHCDSTILVGDTNQSFTPTTQGLYAVITTYNGCVDTSLCDCDASTISITENSKENYKIYPNPAQSSVKITGLNKGEKIKIFNVSGQKIDELIYDGVEFSIQDFKQGIYYIEINSGVVKLKLIKN